jgi:excisionase family DNA binding protein
MADNAVPQKPGALSIKTAAQLLGLSEVYIRRMIQQGKIKTNRVQVGDSDIWRHEIPADVLEAWRKSSAVHTVRTDGRSKFVMYATAAELNTIKEFIAKSNLGTVIDKANKPEDVQKRYAAQKARRAQKKAEAKAKAKATAVA